MDRAWLLSLTLCFFANKYFSTAQCPHDGQLDKWSDDSTWALQKPNKNDNVTITKPILLDESPPELFSITIEDGGRLVWSPLMDIDLRVHYILIKGRMDIGSEDCKYPAKATITLIGERGDYSISGFAEKFIGVAEDGTLELHGQNKLPWTKLTTTVNKLSTDYGLIFRHLDQKDITKVAISGARIYVFDPITGKPEKNEVIQLWYRTQKHVDNMVKRFKVFLDDIADGKVVAMAVQRSFVDKKLDLSEFYDTVEELTYGSIIRKSSAFRNIKKNGAWAMVTVKGDSSKTHEQLTAKSGNRGQLAEATLTLINNTRKFDITSYIHNKIAGACFADFVVSDTAYSMPKLDVVDDVTSWNEGDTVVVTSTDYNWEQAEKAKIITCEDCTSNQIRVLWSPKFTHFGEIYKNVDMRAEVALLTRNIKIQGETTDKKQFGGHTKYLKGFKNVHIEGVEFTNMGQQTDLGRYPIHFHMCEDVDNYDDPPYIRQNSIHHTHARCATIHGTHGLTLSDNVCYDTLGIGYFLEDGGEKRTVFDGNLGLGQKKATLISSDRRPATFWITNPQTYLRNNVAAGGSGHGYWYTYPDLPLGPSADKEFMNETEARHTAIYEFFNNVAHSYERSGLFIDNILKPDGIPTGYSMYEPWQDPFDPESGPKAVYLTRYTGYKNRISNVWIRGGLFKLKQFSLSDSSEGLQFLRDNDQEQYLTESVIIGDSPNLGEPTMYWENGTKKYYHRSLPLAGNRFASRQGIRLFNGPIFVNDTWFDGFKDTEYYKSGAITLRINNRHNTALSSFSGLEFGFNDGDSSGNRVKAFSDVLSLMKDDHIATFRDVDGSITSLPGSQLVPSHPFFLTSSCVNRTNWNMAYCPYPYGLVFVRGLQHEDINILRDDDPNLIDVSSDGVDKNSKFLVILNGVYSYTVFWSKSVPDAFILTGVGVTRDDTVRVGVCVPRNATFSFFGFNMPTIASRFYMWTRVNSTDEIDEDEEGAKFLYDSDVGILFLKLIHKSKRLPGDPYDCPGNKCARVIIRIDSGDLKDKDCVKRAFPKYKNIIPSERSYRYRRAPVFPATSATPPANWGAGSTRPFPPQI